MNGQVFTLDDTPCTRCICQVSWPEGLGLPARPACHTRDPELTCSSCRSLSPSPPATHSSLEVHGCHLSSRPGPRHFSLYPPLFCTSHHWHKRPGRALLQAGRVLRVSSWCLSVCSAGRSELRKGPLPASLY